MTTESLERAAIVALTALALGLFAAMPVWRWPDAAPSRSGYVIDAEDFGARMAAQPADADGVVRPPPGDVYIAARQWEFQPQLALQAGKTYRLHLTSFDALHGFSLGGRDVLLTPGRAEVMEFTPETPGRLPIQCSEFCGAGHNRMTAWVEVVEP